MRSIKQICLGVLGVPVLLEWVIDWLQRIDFVAKYDWVDSILPWRGIMIANIGLYWTWASNAAIIGFLVLLVMVVFEERSDRWFARKIRKIFTKTELISCTNAIELAYESKLYKLHTEPRGAVSLTGLEVLKANAPTGILNQKYSTLREGSVLEAKAKIEMLFKTAIKNGYIESKPSQKSKDFSIQYSGNTIYLDKEQFYCWLEKEESNYVREQKTNP